MDEELDKKTDDSPIERWHKELDLSKDRDKDWCVEAKRANKTYRNDRRIGGTGDHAANKKDTFNILWSNVETVRPALYNTIPRPDIRRRFKDKDPLGKHVSEILERASTFTVEGSNFDERMIDATNDMLLPGRGVTRVKYIPTFSDPQVDEAGEDIPDSEEVLSEEVDYDHVQWDDFRLGPGESWKNLPWIAFGHNLDQEQVEELNPDLAPKLTYGTIKQGKTDQDRKENERVTKQARFWEIWDKETRQVIWIAEEYKDSVIKVEEDPLNMKEFWPIPRPCYAIESTDSLVPITDFSQYETLANNLEDVTNRMLKITRALRVRGIYDSTMPEVAKIFDATDNDMLPAENLSRLVQGGGLDKFIWMFPNETLANVLMILRQYRADIISDIYQLTGISDIQRGDTNANETLGAQQLKADYGSQRLQRKQREIQRYARDLIRLTVEIIGENFTIETLKKMTGLQYLTQEEKQQLDVQKQAMEQQAQQTGQPPQIPPELIELYQKPTWEELKEVMSDDILRQYRVDIETDSTIQDSQAADQQAMAVLFQGIGQFINGIQPAVEAGVMTKKGAKSLLTSVVRKFRLGREVEDALLEEEEQQQPNPEQQKQQAEQKKQQADMQVKQAENQAKMAELQLQMQQDKAEHQAKMAEMQMKMQVDKSKFEHEMAKIRATPVKAVGGSSA